MQKMKLKKDFIFAAKIGMETMAVRMQEEE